MSKTNKKTVNRDELYAFTKHILETGDQIDSMEKEDAIDSINQSCEAIEKVIRTLSLTPVKGIGGPIGSLKLYNQIMKEILDDLSDDKETEKYRLKAIEYLADRIKDKLYERLYPENKPFVNNRFKMAETLFAQYKGRFDSIMGAYDIVSKVSQYDRVFIYEEDFESLTTKRILEAKGIVGFTAFISDKDVYRLNDCKVSSFLEAGITNTDLLIIPSRWQLRKYDLEIVKKYKIENILELNLFDDRTEEFYKYLPDELLEFESRLTALKVDEQSN